nr:hypothetical protein [Tanacetum cinerariifolium]
MEAPLSPDRVFDFLMAELEPHVVYDFIAAESIPGLAEAPGNMNRWIEEDVPLEGEMDDPIEIVGGANEAGLDLIFGYDTDDNDDEDDEWLMAPVMPRMATVTFLSTYEVGGPMGNLEYIHGALVKKMGTVSDAQVADSIAVGEIWLRVTTIEGQVQVMASQAVHVVSRLEGNETRVQQNQQLRARLAELESCEGTLMLYMLWMEEHLAVLEKKLLGPSPRPQ